MLIKFKEQKSDLNKQDIFDIEREWSCACVYAINDNHLRDIEKLLDENESKYNIVITEIKDGVVDFGYYVHFIFPKRYTDDIYTMFKSLPPTIFYLF